MAWLETATALLNTKGGASLAGGLGSALGPKPAGPSNAESAAYGLNNDSSGWNVNFSGVQSATSAQDKSGGVPGLGISGVGGGAVPWWVWAGVAALAAVVVLRKRAR